MVDGLQWLGMSATCPFLCTLNLGERKRKAYRMLFLLHLLFSAVLEGPFDNISFWRCTLDMLALSELGPEVVEVLKLD